MYARRGWVSIRRPERPVPVPDNFVSHNRVLCPWRQSENCATSPTNRPFSSITVLKKWTLVRPFCDFRDLSDFTTKMFYFYLQYYCVVGGILLHTRLYGQSDTQIQYLKKTKPIHSINTSSGYCFKQYLRWKNITQKTMIFLSRFIFWTRSIVEFIIIIRAPHHIR